MWQLIHISVTIGNSIPSLHIFTIWWVIGWQRSMRRPPWTRMKNGPPFIMNCSSPGGSSRERECSNNALIYTPHPKTAPDQKMLNRYFTSQETPQRWHARPWLSDPRLGGGGCCVVSWTHTLRHGESNTPPKMTLYIICGTSLTFASPQKIRLGPGMCWDDAYV